MRTNSRPHRMRRSLLVFPATELRMANKAAACAADCVIFDLEDSVPHENKAQARSVIRDAVKQIDFGGKEICVRINAVESPYFEDDMRAIEGLPIHAVVVPKVETVRDVRSVDAALTSHGGRTGQDSGLVLLHLAVETPRGLFDCRDFAQASPRVDALIFGAGDFVAASGFSSEESALTYPRSHLSLVASTLNIDALDLVFVDLADLDGLGRSAAAGRDLGYAGKWVIHPGQVDVVNRAFDPGSAAISRAHRILETLQEAARRGRGAATLDGSLVDEASIRWAKAIVARIEPTGS